VNTRDVISASMSEADLQRAIIDTARLHGWLVHHDRPVTDRRGRTRTAVAGDAGFPDLVIAKDGVVLFIECKSVHGRYEPGQRDWLDAVRGTTVRPADLDRLLARLRN
jgi:hypothetical protein